MNAAPRASLRRRVATWRAGERDDVGQALAVELLAVLPIFLGVLAAIVYVGHLTTTSAQVTNVAQSAAREASLASNEQDAVQRAIDAVQGSTLSASCRTPSTPVVTVHPGPAGSWRGGSVSVTVRCEVRNADLVSLWVPGTHTLSATDTQAVDGYRT